MTPYEILTELAEVRKLPVAREVQRRAGASVTCTDLLTLWDLAHGKCIKADTIKTRRANLIKAGLMESIRGSEIAKNHRVVVYQLTLEGIDIIENLREELTKISERIKRKQDNE
jgi:DNA-binding MarR family transcriptional regulator